MKMKASIENSYKIFKTKTKTTTKKQNKNPTATTTSYTHKREIAHWVHHEGSIR